MSFDRSYADIAFRNGRVITVDAADTIAEAVAVKGGRIVFVGSDAELDEIIDAGTTVVDLGGRTLMPGMIDTHYHPILAGLLGKEPGSPMIDTYDVRSIPELLDIHRRARALKRPGEWVSSMGYEPSLLAENRHPTIEELDEISPDAPIHCMHGGGHICMYNSKALEYLGVRTAEDAAKYPKDEVEVIDGKLTGMVRGHTHFWLWGQVSYSEEGQRAAAMKSHAHCLRNGITSICDCGELGASSFHIMQKLCRSREFKVRSWMMLHDIFGKPFSRDENAKWMGLGLMSGLGDEHFRIGTSKFMIDGGSSGPSCATREPYSHDPSLPREKGWTREEVAEYIAQINAAECQASAHAIGDEAIEFMVEGYERAFAVDPRPDLRHRIEHCTIVDEDLCVRMGRMNICPSVNVASIYKLGKKFAHFYGPERNRYICAIRTMLDNGVKCSLHSDWPSYPSGIPVLDAAVNRIDRTEGYQCDRTQAVSVLEAIRCATYNGAYATFEEGIKGSIELGKLADMIVLSDDILSIPREDIWKLRVDMTMIDGEILYEAE